jgi:hypothetical protein
MVLLRIIHIYFVQNLEVTQRFPIRTNEFYEVLFPICEL